MKYLITAPLSVMPNDNDQSIFYQLCEHDHAPDAKIDVTFKTLPDGAVEVHVWLKPATPPEGPVDPGQIQEQIDQIKRNITAQLDPYTHAVVKAIDDEKGTVVVDPKTVPLDTEAKLEDPGNEGHDVTDNM